MPCSRVAVELRTRPSFFRPSRPTLSLLHAFRIPPGLFGWVMIFCCEKMMASWSHLLKRNSRNCRWTVSDSTVDIDWLVTLPLRGNLLALSYDVGIWLALFQMTWEFGLLSVRWRGNFGLLSSGWRGNLVCSLPDDVAIGLLSCASGHSVAITILGVIRCNPLGTGKQMSEVIMPVHSCLMFWFLFWFLFV